MPRIIQLSPDGGGRYIAVDHEGQVWRGETKQPKDGGEEYIVWKPLRSEFPKDNSPQPADRPEVAARGAASL